MHTSWFDLDRMKGSTVDAMSEAIDHADVLLYGVCSSYKESANVSYNDCISVYVSVVRMGRKLLTCLH